MDLEKTSTTEEKFSVRFRPRYEKRFSLSAVPSAREYKSSSCGFLRDCHAIYDIEILDPHDCISEVKFYLNDMFIDSPKEGNKWAIAKWFTSERVFPVSLLPYMKDYLSISFKDGDFKEEKEIQIAWKKVKYDAETQDKLLKLSNLSITYHSFRLIFSGGLAGFIGRLDLPYPGQEKYKITCEGVQEGT